jgi:hypothetical protein
VDAEAVLARLDKEIEIMYSKYYSMKFEELMQQQTLISKKYNAAWQAGASQEVMNQLVGHLEAIKQAIWEMSYKQNYEASENKDSDQFKDSIL